MEKNVNNTSLIATSICKHDCNRREVAFTFDVEIQSSQTAGNVEPILSVLNKHAVKATFFILGEWAKRFPAMLFNIHSAGHVIGNHSYNHPDFNQIALPEMVNEITLAEKEIYNIIGVSSRPLFRVPYGRRHNDIMYRAIAIAGFSYAIYWNIDTLDWQHPPVTSIVNRVLSELKDGSIILMHNSGESTSLALDYLLPAIKEQGFTQVTISELLR